jgi:hypothetical protein
VRVPEEAAEGKAQVKLTFPDLKTFKVASATTEIVVKKAVADEKPAERAHGPVPPEPAPAPAR